MGLNGAGVEQMQGRNLKKAIDCFHQAYCELSRSPFDDESLPESKLKLSAGIRRLLCSEPIPRGATATQDNFACFRRALLIAPQTVKCHDPANSSFMKSMFAATVTYNMALAHNIYALESGNFETLQKASHLYAMAYNLFDNHMITEESLHLIQLGLLGCVNNIGHIHAYCQSVDETYVCIQEICLRLSAFSPFDEGSGGVISHDEHDELFLNACLFSRDSLVAAPAA